MNSELLAYSYKTQPIHIQSIIPKNIYSSEYPPTSLSPPKEDMFNKLIRDRLLRSRLLIHNNYYNIYQLK
jgi:hypothetical protein